MSEAPLSARSEAELQSILETRTGPFQAWSAGVRLAARTAAVGLPMALVYGAVSGGITVGALELADGATTASKPMLELTAQIALAAGAFTSVYGLIQFSKRDRVSRESWWPALFAIPLLLVGLALYLEHSGAAKGIGPVVDSLVFMAVTLVVQTFVGAVAAVVWIRAGNDALEGRTTDGATLLSEARRRLLEVAGPHGAKVHAVTIGAQLLLPGIFYALQLAFTECVVVLDPEKPALRRSGQLTQNMRGRLFRLLLLWWLIAMFAALGAGALIEGKTAPDELVELVTKYFIDPSSLSETTALVQELIWGVLGWILTLALLVLYREQEARYKARSDLRKLKAEGATG